MSKFLKPDWEYRDGKSIDESEKEKRKEFDEFVKANDWRNLEKFLLNINVLYKQQKDNAWRIESAVTDIYFSIARKDKSEFENALRLFFSGTVLFPLRVNVIYVALTGNIMTGKELLDIMNDYEFQGKSYWESVLVAMLPEEQVDESFLILLINTFRRIDENIYIHKMLDYLKYETVFTEYKSGNPALENHNIITYITSIILDKARKTHRDFGFNLCAECSLYFTNYPNLIKNAYWTQYELDPRFDYDGKELKAILDLDRTFIHDSLKNDTIGLRYSSVIRLHDINTSVLWEYPEYEELIEDLLLIIEEKENFFSIIEKNVFALFGVRKNTSGLIPKMKSLILKLTQKY